MTFLGNILVVAKEVHQWVSASEYRMPPTGLPFVLRSIANNQIKGKNNTSKWIGSYILATIILQITSSLVKSKGIEQQLDKHKISSMWNK